MPPTPVHPGVGQSRHHAVPEGFWGSKATPRAGGRDPICRIGHWGRPGSVAALQVPEWTPLTPGRYGQAWWRCVTSLPVRLLLVESLGRTSVPLMDLGHPPAPLKGHGASLGQPTAMATPGLHVLPPLSCPTCGHLRVDTGFHGAQPCSSSLSAGLCLGPVAALPVVLQQGRAGSMAPGVSSNIQTLPAGRGGYTSHSSRVGSSGCCGQVQQWHRAV